MNPQHQVTRLFRRWRLNAQASRLARGARFKPSVTRRVKKLEQLIEKKHHDATPGIKNFANDEPLYAMSLIAQGDTSSTRTGLQIHAKSLKINMEVGFQIGDPVTSARLIIVQDMQNQGALPTVTSVLEANTLMSQWNNVNEGKRYKILYDRFINNPQPGIASDYSFRKTIKINRKMYFLGSTGTQADAGKNSIYALFITDNTLASGNAPTANFTYRLYYEDL